jgi:hypothetical protein
MVGFDDLLAAASWSAKLSRRASPVLEGLEANPQAIDEPSDDDPIVFYGKSLGLNRFFRLRWEEGGELLDEQRLSGASAGRLRMPKWVSVESTNVAMPTTSAGGRKHQVTASDRATFVG